jgi:hypothetical protein
LVDATQIFLAEGSVEMMGEVEDRVRFRLILLKSKLSKRNRKKERGEEERIDPEKKFHSKLDRL